MERHGSLSTTFAGRIENRPQITTDAFAAYYGTIRTGFDRDVDYAQIHQGIRFRTKQGTRALFAACNDGM